MTRFLFSLLGACSLFSTGWALKCEYDTSIDEEQGLNFMHAVGRVATEPAEGVSDPDQCRERCCQSTECDMVQIGYPMDGLPQCTLVKCWVDGRDVCELEPSTQFKVYRRTSSVRRESPDGTKRRIVPLVQSFQPKESNESNNSKRRGTQYHRPFNCLL